MFWNSIPDLYKKAPTDEAIWAKSKELASPILKEMGNLKYTAGLAIEVKETAKKLFEEKQHTEEWDKIIHCLVSG